MRRGARRAPGRRPRTRPSSARLIALANLEHRGAEGADGQDRRRRRDPDPAARRVLRARCSTPSCRPSGATASRSASSRTTPARRAELRGGCSSDTVAAEGQRVVGWRDVPVDAAPRRQAPREPSMPRDPPALRRRRAGARGDQDAFERQLYVIRRRAELAARRRPRGPDASPRARSSTRGCSRRRSCRRLLPRPLRPAARERARARALALLDQHLPELGARAPVPADRPQRRDQHAAAATCNWMRARGGALARSCFGDDLARCCRWSDPAASDSAVFDTVLELLVARRPLAAARGDDDGPGGVRGPRRPAPEELTGFYDYHQC